jgi:hypothetical protein
MENSYNNFVEYKISTKNNNLIFLFDVKKDLPTAFEWTCAVEDFKTNMVVIMKEETPFAFILDVRLLGMLSITQIKEFSKVLESYGPFLEKKLICSTVVAEGNIIKNIFELVKMFYKTVKPLKIVHSMDDAQVYIEECKLKFK